MTIDGEHPEQNPLLTLCDKQKQLLTQSLGVIVAAFAITFLFTDGLWCVDWLQWVWVVDVVLLIYYKESYRRAVKAFNSAVESAPEAYCNAKMRQYNVLASGIYVNSVILVLCPKLWIILVAFVLWVILFVSLPKRSELQKDFGDDAL
jgi:hypothetical protein